MAGVKGQQGGGGPRPNSGRKPKPLSEELRRLLDAAWPEEKRKKVIETAVVAAEAGDMTAFRTLMAYGYGTPVNGDETKFRETLEVEVDKIFSSVEKHLGKDALRKLRAGIIADVRGSGTPGSGGSTASS